MVIDNFIIYIRLLDENVDVFRPTYGKIIKDMIFKVLPTKDYDPEDEHWEFVPGTMVKCVKKFNSSLDKVILVAIEKFEY